MRRIYRRRMGKLLDLMEGMELDAIVGVRPPTVQYFTGCRTVGCPPRTLYFTAFNNGELEILAPRLEVNQAREEAALGVIVEVPRGVSWLKALAERLEKRGVSRVGIELSGIPHNAYKHLSAGNEIAVEDVSEALASLRAVKSPEEIRIIRRAVRIAEEGLEAARRNVRPGSRERLVARRAIYRMMARGAEWVSFEILVASGPRAAYSHGAATNRKIGEGEPVIVDLGARVEGYHSDLTRTFIAGSNEKFREILGILDEAIEAALRMVRPGVPASEVDKAARDVIREYGCGDYFTHGLGHGIGLEIHEKPLLRPGSKEELKEGNVFTIEPGIYIPGLGGARIEEDVAVTGTGHLKLSEYPRIP